MSNADDQDESPSQLEIIHSSLPATALFQRAISEIARQFQEQRQEVFGDLNQPTDKIISRISPRYATKLAATIGSTSTGRLPGSFDIDRFNAAWWRSVECRLSSCEKCLSQPHEVAPCTTDNTQAIQLGKTPGWSINNDTLEPVEIDCSRWAEYQIRDRLVRSGMPDALVQKIYKPHPRDEEVLEKLRVAIDRGITLGVIGELAARHHAMVVMARYLARQRRKRPFRVELIDIDLRRKLKEHSDPSPIMELLNYRWCLFIVAVGTSLNEWMVTEIKELLQHRAMYKKPTIIMDTTPDLVSCLRGVGEVLRCDVT